jgi:TRAP-type C4-dicarboxylate transport system substrate-binding protein
MGAIMKKMKWSVIISLSVVFLFSSLAISHAAKNKPISISWATFYPATHPLYPMNEAWGTEIEKRTNGQVKFTYYPGSTLLKGNEIPDGILKGIADVGAGVSAYTPGRFFAMETVNLTIGYSSAKMATFVVNEFYKKFKPKEFDDYKVFYLHAHGPGILHSKGPVRNLEEVKGLKIRAVGAAAKATQALGAVPVAMPMFDTYESLRKGVVEATLSPIEALMTWKQAEVVKYTTECFGIGYTSHFYIAMSRKKWDSLPTDVQRVFEEVSAEWIPKAAEVWDSADERGRKFALDMGHTIIPLSDEENERWAEAVQPVITEHEKEAEAKGLPGKEYVAAVRALIKEFKESQK